jgi:hypothetical protein
VRREDHHIVACQHGWGQRGRIDRSFVFGKDGFGQREGSLAWTLGKTGCGGECVEKQSDACRAASGFAVEERGHCAVEVVGNGREVGAAAGGSPAGEFGEDGTDAVQVGAGGRASTRGDLGGTEGGDARVVFDTGGQTVGGDGGGQETVDQEESACGDQDVAWPKGAVGRRCVHGLDGSHEGLRDTEALLGGEACSLPVACVDDVAERGGFDVGVHQHHAARHGEDLTGHHHPWEGTPDEHPELAHEFGALAVVGDQRITDYFEHDEGVGPHVARQPRRAERTLPQGASQREARIDHGAGVEAHTAVCGIVDGVEFVVVCPWRRGSGCGEARGDGAPWGNKGKGVWGAWGRRSRGRVRR